MSIIDTLITDRTAADTAALEALFAKAKAGSLTEEERAILADPAHKGVYNHTDLNRVGAAMDYLRARLEGHGYAVKGYNRLKVPHTGAAQLPGGYTQVEYIESSGTQYIDTGVVPSVGTQAVIDFQATSTPTSNWWILGAVTSGTILWRSGVNSSSFRTDGGFTYSQTSSLTAYTVATGTCAINMSIPLYLFAQNEGGAVEFGKFKLYSCQIYGNGTITRDYVPCISPDGAYGLYDKANRKFYGNAGSGVFTGGPELKDESKDPYLWYESDIPAAAEMTRYLQNVSAIRAVLAALPTTPSVPADMEVLTAAEANAIEVILMDVETLINNMIADWLFCGDVYSGEV